MAEEVIHTDKKLKKYPFGVEDMVLVDGVYQNPSANKSFYANVKSGGVKINQKLTSFLNAYLT